MRKLIFLKRIMSGDEVVAHVFRTLAAGDVNRIQLGQEENFGKQPSHQSRILQQASEVDARELVDHHCQGLESDYSTSTIPPEQKDSCQWAEVTSWMKIWEVTLDKGPRGSKSMWHCSLRSLSLPLAANHVHTVT